MNETYQRQAEVWLAVHQKMILWFYHMELLIVHHSILLKYDYQYLTVTGKKKEKNWEIKEKKNGEKKKWDAKIAEEKVENNKKEKMFVITASKCTHLSSA